MTLVQLASYYANLLILQYIGMPDAYAVILNLVTPALINQIPSQMINAFNVNTAVGVQLNVIGEYVGVSRVNYTLGKLPITLSDSDYRVLIKLQILANNSGSSLATIQSLLATTFPGQILVADNQVMGLNYEILNTLGSTNLLSILATGAYLPAPMGVQISATVVSSISKHYFEFRTYSNPSTGSPFNNYAAYNLNYPWFSYL